MKVLVNDIKMIKIDIVESQKQRNYFCKCLVNMLPCLNLCPKCREKLINDGNYENTRVVENNHVVLHILSDIKRAFECR